MPIDLPLRCVCGSMRGVVRGVSPDTVNRVVCGCGACQQYAHRLGRADEILDEHGGTQVFQASPATLRLTDGAEHLACLQQTKKGAFRWYAGCCDSPIANTLPTMNVPFMAVLHSAIDRAHITASLSDMLGPVRVTVNKRFAPEQARRLKATRRALMKMLFRYAPMILRWRVRGDHKRSPFFEPTTGRPVVTPRRLWQVNALPEPGLKPRRAGCG